MDLCCHSREQNSNAVLSLLAGCWKHKCNVFRYNCFAATCSHPAASRPGDARLVLLCVACYTVFDGEPALDISKDEPFSPKLLSIIIQVLGTNTAWCTGGTSCLIPAGGPPRHRRRRIDGLCKCFCHQCRCLCCWMIPACLPRASFSPSLLGADAF